MARLAKWLSLATGVVGLLAIGCQLRPVLAPPIKVGLIAPFTGGSGASGEAIQRGMLLAMDEVNRDGGVLGRKFAIVTRDVQNDPAVGVAALRDLVQQDAIVAIFGGIFSPVMLGQLDEIHRMRLPLINAWGSATRITKNGRTPNFAFRVSASDEQADEFLVRYAVDVVGVRRPAIIADTTAWGESNIGGLSDWLARRGIVAPSIERYDQGDTNMSRQIGRLRASGADSLILVSPGPEGAAIVRAMAALGWRVPIVSHWGISGGRFVETAGLDNAEGILTMQTFSFYEARSARIQAVLNAYHARFGTRRIDEILAPVGVAQGYDGVHLLARAIQQAGSVEGLGLRDSLERLDVLFSDDYMMACWKNGQLVPAPRPRLTSP